jgi:hypothetical protein
MHLRKGGFLVRRWIACLVLAVVLTGQALCEQVYVRNKPFKGAVAGAGPSTTVDLATLVGALGFTLTEMNGNWVVTGAGETPALPTEAAPDARQVYFKGKSILTATEGGASMVPVISTAQALGAVAKHNKDMGSIDVNLPVGQMTAAAPTTSGSSSSGSPAWSSSGSGGYKLVNFWASW